MTESATPGERLEVIRPMQERIAGRRWTAAEVFHAHAGFVLRLARRLGAAPSDVEDIAQETFVIVQRRIADVDPSAEIRSWLFGVVRRVLANHRRQAHRRREQPGLTTEMQAVPAQQGEALERSQARALLERALDQLEVDKRAVFVLFELEGLPMREVAAIVDCPLATAYSRLRRAREAVARSVLGSAAELRRQP